VARSDFVNALNRIKCPLTSNLDPSLSSTQDGSFPRRWRCGTERVGDCAVHLYPPRLEQPHRMSRFEAPGSKLEDPSVEVRLPSPRESLAGGP
jgi:hypothetical protein